MGRTVPYYQFHIYMIAHAQNKRRGQTKVFPLLLIPLLFLAVVRRFLKESYTDISFLPGYDWVDVCVCGTVLFCFCEPEDFLHRTPFQGAQDWCGV